MVLDPTDSIATTVIVPGEMLERFLSIHDEDYLPLVIYIEANVLQSTFFVFIRRLNSKQSCMHISEIHLLTFIAKQINSTALLPVKRRPELCIQLLL